jgi:5-formyltetrahydrofolate cyclo-ligase
MPREGHHGFIPSSAEDLLRRRVKSELRKRMRGLRATIPRAACAERSAKIAARLGALEPVVRARSVALFWPLEARHEVDLRALDADLRSRGVRVAYPALVGATGEAGAMVFRFPSTPDTMVEGPFGLREPAEGDPVASRGDLDVLIVPALAIDPRGHRIGYGAGYYDRAIGAYAPPAVAIAVAYDFQLLAEIPDTEGDVPVGWIVTDARSAEAEGR